MYVITFLFLLHMPSRKHEGPEGKEGKQKSRGCYAFALLARSTAARRRACYPLLVSSMLPQVGSGGLGSYHEKVDARNQKSTQRPNQKTLDEVGR